MQPGDPRSILAELANPAAYAAELASLGERHAEVGRRQWQQSGVELREIGPSSRALLAKELAKTVVSGDYRFSPSVARTAHVGGKARVLYRGSITDAAVVGVVAKALRRLVEPMLSRTVYSYRRGRSSLEAVRDFAAFLREHAITRPDPRERGLHVMRRDVARYGESIPVHDASPLWPQLDAVFAHWGIAEKEPLVLLTRAAVRPLIAGDQGEHYLERGVPTGSSIQPVICNLYLNALDHQLAAIDGGFYARFGDDIVFAHADAEAAASARNAADSIVTAHELAFKAEKSKDIYFNAAGRSSGEFAGTAFIEYLGLRLSFAGAVGLPTPKARRLLRELTRRFDNCVRLIRDIETPEALELLCNTAKASLDPRSPLAQTLVPILAHAVDDRGQLRHLDYLLALALVRRLSRRRGVRAFREVPYATLRRAGLPSLLNARNQK
jgi:hypothetical protein